MPGVCESGTPRVTNPQQTGAATVRQQKWSACLNVRGRWPVRLCLSAVWGCQLNKLYMRKLNNNRVSENTYSLPWFCIHSFSNNRSYHWASRRMVCYVSPIWQEVVCGEMLWFVEWEEATLFAWRLSHSTHSTAQLFKSGNCRLKKDGNASLVAAREYPYHYRVAAWAIEMAQSLLNEIVRNDCICEG